jgi:membrane associated rhomboid family serine protease
MSQFKFHRPESFPPIVKNLMIINGLVFVAQLMFKDQDLTSKLGLWPVESAHFKPYQVFTHMFAHSPTDIFHLLFNMLALWMFGRVLENVWGPKRFLTFYLLCGLGAAVAHMAVNYFQYKEILEIAQSFRAMGREDLAILQLDEPFYAVGASGAIMGILVAFAYLFPNTPLMIIPFPFPIKAKWLVIGYIAFDLIAGLGRAGTGIAHFAHLGGALTGFLIVLFWNKNNRRTLY